MRVLHLFSNKRWTGPAEPAANLAAGLQQAGLDITFACAAAGAQAPHRIARNVEARGLTVRSDLTLPKHFRPVAVFRDAERLSRDLRDKKYDLMHCHQPVDHCVAGLARGFAKAPVPIVRSLYDTEGVNVSWVNDRAVRRWTDALCVPSPAVRDALAGGGVLPAERLHVVEGAVDTGRFDATRSWPDVRPRWGIGRDHVVFGVVARMQPYRRFDVLFAALRSAIDRVPNLRLVIVGRGTREKEVARIPVQRMGLSRHVHFAGYLEGDDYVAALAAMDMLIFLMPGSDGTCRTVREALAMGLPAVVARRGILPWLVEDQRTGLVIDDTEEGLADTLVRLAEDEPLRRRLRAAARDEGPGRFALMRQVAAVRSVYERVKRA